VKPIQALGGIDRAIRLGRIDRAIKLGKLLRAVVAWLPGFRIEELPTS
jgi:hypothetical protein